MSGPKTSIYSLNRERLRKQRARKKLETEIENLESRVKALCQQFCVDEMPAPAESNSEEALADYRNQLKSVLVSLESRTSQKTRDTDFVNNLSAIKTTSRTIRRISADDRDEAASLRDAIASLTTPDAERIKSELTQVVDTGIPLSAELRKASQQLAKSADDTLAGEIAVEALEKLGYEVEGDFNTLFVEGGMLHFQKAGWGDYYVRMRVDTEESFLNFNMVRAGKADDTRERKNKDREMEAAWCNGYPELLDELRELGITCGTMRALEPGAVAVQTVPPEVVGIASSEANHVAECVAKERSL